MNSRFVLGGDICYCEDIQTLRCIPGGYLVCEDGVSLGAYARLPAEYAAWPLRDEGNALILPGLVDTHVHASQYSYRGLGMDLELLDWLTAHAFPEEAKYEDLGYAREAYAAFVDAVRRSPNTRAVIFATRHVPATLLLMDMLEASGLVTMVGKVGMDRDCPDGLREASAQASLDDTRAWLAQAKARQYRATAPILTPRFIPSCSDALLTGLGALRKEMDLPVQSHLSENPGECALVRTLCPDDAFYGAAYDRFGLLGPGTVMAHCVYSTDEELALLRERGVLISHCPQSNTNVSSGIAPVRRFLRQRVRVGLGSDVAGGCHPSLFRAMSDAIQVSKLRWRLVDDQEPALTLPETLYLATVGGGSLFGKVGSFAPGYELDALVIDDSPLAAPFPLALEERLSRVVYLSDDRHIRQKYVRGEALFHDK